MLKHLAIAGLLTGLSAAGIVQAAPRAVSPGTQYITPVEAGGLVVRVNAEQPALDEAAQRRVRAAIQALIPEYNARVRRDGETSANDWIRQKAFELGQQEAEVMNQRLGRQ